MVSKKELTKFLEELDYKELKALTVQCQELIAEREIEAREEAKKKLQAQASELGFDLGDLFPTSVRAKRSGSSGERPPAAIKYRNPKNHTEVWTGRGRPPRWMMREIGESNNKKKKEDFLI